MAELNARRKATQPINRRTFGSVFKNPDHELGAGADARRLRSQGPRRRRSTHLTEARELHRERRTRATASDALALMAEARRRALEQYGVVLEREVELLGDLDLPPAGRAT